jgi:hypothetical protein
MRTKEEVRKWTQQRWTAPKPLPTLEEIKRQLGHYDFLKNKSADCAR